MSLDQRWSDLTRSPVQEWENNKSKIDLSFFTPEQGIKLVEALSSEVSRSFYAKPNANPYEFYWEFLRLPNRTIMSAALELFEGK